jgi:outer membrane lipoprotein LolB
MLDGRAGHLATPVRTLALVATALWVAACTTLPAVSEGERVHAGRFAATTTLDGRSENTTGRFTLTVGADRLVVDLASAIGTTLARIESGPEGAVLRAAGNGASEVRGRDAAALAEQVLGWPMPVAGIGHWIVGRPDPRRPSRAITDTEGVTAFEQDGWRIEIAEQFENGSPRRLVMTRPARAGTTIAPAAPAVTLRIVLDAVEPVAAI